MRLPLRWAATQAQTDYSQGFMKRGLFGALCEALHVPIYRYTCFTLIAFVLLLAFLSIFYRYVQSSGLPRFADGAFLTVMASSYAITYMVSLAGYFDIVLLLLTLAVLAFRRSRTQIAGAIALGSIAILFHEIYAIVLLPLSLLPFVLWRQTLTLPAARRRHLALLVFGFAVPWALVFTLAKQPALNIAQIDALIQRISARTDFAIDAGMLRHYGLSGADNAHYVLATLKYGGWYVLQTFVLAAFLPTALFFLAICFRLLQRNRKRVDPFVALYLVFAVLSPLLMNFLGYDIYRWGALMGVNALLAAAAVSRHCRDAVPAPTFGPAFRHVAILLIALNLATDIGLFGRGAKSFPFIDYWSDFAAARSAHSSWIHLPPVSPDARPQ